MANDFLKWLAQEAQERTAKYRMYREYYDGEHDVQLTARQRKYLQVGSEQEFSANYIPIVVDGLANRLLVKEFDGDNEKLINEWWTMGNMDSHQHAVHVSAIRDGDSYLMVDWDPIEERPIFVPHIAYDGRGGVTVHYSDEQLAPIAATKRWWIEFGPMAGKMRRMNIYYPERIERYYASDNSGEWGWLPYTGDGYEAVLPWVNEKTGEPIGIPLIHFTNRSRGMRYGVSEMEPGIPMQNALNKAVVDLLAAADASGFRIMVMVGDDADGVQVSPGMFINSLKHASEVNVSAIPGEPMRPLIEVVDSFVQRIGQVTDTPLSYFQQSGQMASEGTHEKHEDRMLVKCRVSSVEFGASWVKAMNQAISTANAFSSMSVKPGALKAVWEDFDTRKTTEKLKEKAEIMQIMVMSGASIEQAALVAGFTDREAKMLAKIDMTMDPMRVQALMAQLPVNQNVNPTANADDTKPVVE
jgi:hypothetical protein